MSALLSFCLPSTVQRVSRASLTNSLKQAKAPADKLLKDLSIDLAKVGPLLAPLKALVSGTREPNLQVMYFNAAAIAPGVLVSIG